MLDVADVESSLSVEEVISAIDRGDTLHGLIALELRAVSRSKPLVSSYLAYCVAKERGQLRQAVGLCQSALALEPENPAHYLNLGRVYLLASDKPRAIAAFWRGISKRAAADMSHTADWPRTAHRREHALIMDELRRLGIRKPPPFKSLRREHPLNKYTGLLLARVGLR
jgi:hypothetical protein